jgi:hypothetical protein
MQLESALDQEIFWQKPPRRKAIAWDGRFTLEDRDVYVEVRAEVHTTSVALFLELKQELGELLVAAAYISPKAKSLLSEQGIHYLDRKGNLQLRIGRIHLHVDGIPNPPPKQAARTRLFAKSGLRALFALLLDPAALNGGYRQLAHRAQVSLGTLPILYQALKEEGHLARGEGGQWILLARERLLERWVVEYTRRLKPSLAIGNFQSPAPQFQQEWRSVTLLSGALWGGEPGADLLTDYLAPSRFTLYTDASKAALIKAYRWRPQEQGEIAAYQKFWAGDPAFDQLAQPLLVYADLLDQGDGRSLELARMIHDRYLRHA